MDCSSCLVLCCISLVVGWEASRAYRRYLPIAGPSLRISQSISGQNYRSYDITEHQFVLTDAQMANLIITAIIRRPFQDKRVFDDRWSDLTNQWRGTWVYESRDNYGRPLYVTDCALVEMFLFYRGYMDPALRDVVEKALNVFPVSGTAIAIRDSAEEGEKRDAFKDSMQQYRAELD